ncbi:DNA helicase II [subsurface metagenome]
MGISDAILQAFPELNDDQREAIGRTEGPLLVIAGPGSSKTLVLVLRTLNLLLQGLSASDGILLCTFTEKAAFELRDRLSLLARKLKYRGDLSQMHVGTIHGIANEFLLRYRHRTPLGNNYEVLDELTQLLFIFDHFEKIVQLNENGKYFGRWSTRWTAIQGTRNYFNKITEELIDQAVLQSSDDPFVHALGRSYNAYVENLFKTNRIDFAFQQKLFLDLLENPEVGQEIKLKIRYVMVD